MMWKNLRGYLKNKDAQNAIEALLAGKEVPIKTTKVFGCSIKWAEKEDLVAKSDREWASRTCNAGYD